MPFDRPQRAFDASDAPANGHSLKEMLAQLEGQGLERNGYDELLACSADAESYYGDNELAIDVLRNKYLAPGEKGPLQMWDRIARAMASVEEDKEHWYDRFFSLLVDFKFIPRWSRNARLRARGSAPEAHSFQLLCHSHRRRQYRGDLPLPQRVRHGLPDGWGSGN